MFRFLRKKRLQRFPALLVGFYATQAFALVVERDLKLKVTYHTLAFSAWVGNLPAFIRTIPLVHGFGAVVFLTYLARAYEALY